MYLLVKNIQLDNDEKLDASDDPFEKVLTLTREDYVRL